MKYISYNIVVVDIDNNILDIVDGEFNKNMAKSELKKIIELDRLDNLERDWGIFKLQRVTRELLK